MKKLLAIALVAAALAALLTTSALAAGPTTPTAPTNQAGSGYGYGAGAGIHAPGGLAQGTGVSARRGAPEWAGDNETAAGILGLTVEQLQAERLSGKSLAAIAADKGISEDTLIAQLLEAHKASVNQLLADGKISQAQADFMLGNMAERIKTMVERTNVGRPDFAGQSPMAGAGRGRWNR